MFRSLLVGLTSVDPSKYDNWDGRDGCWGCELDVDNIQFILKSLDYNKISVLKTKTATADAILAKLEEAARKCQPGDLFVFYFSGHGGQVPDIGDDEPDNKDETLIAYDREIIDDELNNIWLKFKSGVHIFMMSDSCNSGTNYKNKGKSIPSSTPMRILNRMGERSRKKMKAQMIHYGGCRDGFPSIGYSGGGAFTEALCQTWDEGRFNGDYRDFHNAIKSKISSRQLAQFNTYGPDNVSPEPFIKSRPFGGPLNIPASNSIDRVKSIRCILDISEDSIVGVESAIHNASEVLRNALDDALSAQHGVASNLLIGSSKEESCVATVTVDLFEEQQNNSSIICATEKISAPKIVVGTGAFIPLWEQNRVLKWKFNDSSIIYHLPHLFPDLDTAKQQIRALFEAAITAWGSSYPIRFEETSNVADFEIEISQFDNCSPRGCSLARAFFPDRGYHELIIYPKMFTQSREDQIKTLIHELGHIAGLRHYFAQADESFLPSEIFGHHDPFTIMNYGFQSVLTENDKSDLEKLYSRVWNGELSHIGGVPIRLFRPYHYP